MNTENELFVFSSLAFLVCFFSHVLLVRTNERQTCAELHFRKKTDLPIVNEKMTFFFFLY